MINRILGSLFAPLEADPGCSCGCGCGCGGRGADYGAGLSGGVGEEVTAMARDIKAEEMDG